MIQPERVEPLNDAEPPRGRGRGRYVLYWMQASQRAECNHALEYAVAEANRLRQPLVAVFGVTEDYPEANARHYAFMLEGLAVTRRNLERRGVQLVVRRADPPRAALELARGASLLVVDRGYTRIQKRWRRDVAAEAPCPVIQVESDAVVPVEEVSDKEEYAARTIRPRIHRLLDKFLVPLPSVPLQRDSLGLDLRGRDFDVSDPVAALAKLNVDRGVAPSTMFRGGADEAERLLAAFLARKLKDYPERRNEPATDGVSHLSPYLHFGQIAPLAVSLRVRDARDAPRAAREAFLEELIVRRELSLNFVHYQPRYDAYECVPAWARATLRHHAHDPRPAVYTPAQLEAAATGDPYWNAAHREMVLTGKMHNYMRMYWGKRILEWTPSPEEAFRVMLHLNNKYELDGRDPNSFAGVAWCFGKHDRPWARRPIFGTVRYMNAAGLRRKCDIEAYVRKVDDIAAVREGSIPSPLAGEGGGVFAAG